jgi:hypothetical protein
MSSPWTGRRTCSTCQSKRKAASDEQIEVFTLEQRGQPRLNTFPMNLRAAVAIPCFYEIVSFIKPVFYSIGILRHDRPLGRI